MTNPQNYERLKFPWHQHRFQDLCTLEIPPLQPYPSAPRQPACGRSSFQRSPRCLPLKHDSCWFHPKVKMQHTLSLPPFTNYPFRNITLPWKPGQDFYYRAHFLLQIMLLLKFIKDKFKGERLYFFIHLSHRLQPICQILPFLAPR